MVGVDTPIESNPTEDGKGKPNIEDEEEKEGQKDEQEEEQEGKQNEGQEKEDEQEKNFWDFLLDELDEFKNWAGDLIKTGNKQTD